MSKQSSKTKYFSRDWHKAVDRIKNKEFELVKIPTEENRADLFTKPLKTPRFRFLKTKLMGGETIQNHFQTPPNHINWKGEEGSQPTQSYTHTAHSNIPQRANMRFTHANIWVRIASWIYRHCSTMGLTRELVSHHCTCTVIFLIDRLYPVWGGVEESRLP